MTKKKIVLCFISLLLVTSLCACGSNSGKADGTKKDVKKKVTTEKEKLEPLVAAVPANSKEYKCDNYSLSLPENWAQLNLDKVEMSFGETKTANEKFTQTINVITEDVTAVDKKMSIETYLKFVTAQLDKMDGCKVESKKLCLINGYEAGIVISNVTNQQMKYKCEQAILLKDGKAYAISFLGNLEGGFDSLKAEAEGIFNSFKIIK